MSESTYAEEPGGVTQPDLMPEADDEADPDADLMRSDSDPLPDAQVPGAGPDGQTNPS